MSSIRKINVFAGYLVTLNQLLMLFSNIAIQEVQEIQERDNGEQERLRNE
jgi:hypothetical protein